jgi:hypothetical protein
MQMALHDLASSNLDEVFYLHQTPAAVLKMPRQSYTQDEVAEAMLDVTDNGLSQNQSAQKHGMPQTTLSDRLRGLPSKSEITQPAQPLSKSQESRLVAWILR